eukprot:TRINITY_DN13302_c0_g1_i1.p1 TRINITY_DN13302_c0_g1~~TRINITY_DN13302_c0_g1_i1.p1  ORF type:complete len:1011 (+),score=244.69 TRINITY_DN13302_c0_g1_i1:142-3174(+)
MSHLGSNVMNFGKHKGQTFEVVFRAQKGYGDWVVKNLGDQEYAQEFIEYCKAMRGGARSATPSSAPAPPQASRPAQSYGQQGVGSLPVPPQAPQPPVGATASGVQLASNVMNFGKHRGQTFESVFRSQQGYGDWVMNNLGDKDYAKEFIEYCKAMGARSTAPASAPAAAQAAASAGNFAAASQPQPVATPGAPSSNPGQSYGQQGGVGSLPVPPQAPQAPVGATGSGVQLASSVMNFGKHKGQSFESVFRSQQGYGLWVMNNLSEHAYAQEFIEYCKAMGVRPTSAQNPPVVSQPAAAAVGTPAQGSGASAGSAAASAGNPWSTASASPQETSPQRIGGSTTLEHAGLPGSPVQPRRQELPGSGASDSAASGQQKRPHPQSASPGQGTSGHERHEDQTHTCEMCGTEDLRHWQVRCSACYRDNMRLLDTPFYVNVPFDQKDQAKARGVGLRWDKDLKKWYVDSGRDISLWEKWHVCCCKCGEAVSYKQKVDPSKVQCPGRECAPERRAREEKEAREREEADRAKNKEAFLLRKRGEFWTSLCKQAKETEIAINAKNEDANEAMAEEKEQQASKKRRTSAGKKSKIITVPFPSFMAGDLTQRCLEVNKGKKTYNPFSAEDAMEDNDLLVIDAKAAAWIRSVGSDAFKKGERDFAEQIEYTPERILEFGCTFHAAEKLFEQWLPSLKKLQDFLRHCLLQSLDAVTPDMIALLQQKLRSAYQTHCPDVEGIFGGRILPRCRQTVGKAWDTYTREQKVDRAVLEYMDNRKSYDSACGENETTTFMRDVMTCVVEELCEAEVLAFQEDEEGGSHDRLYFNKEREENGFSVMLAHPNTRAADLFSMEARQNAARKMLKDDKGLTDNDVKLYLTPEEHRERIFASYRKLHWRIVREVRSGVYATYGVDEGLRSEDRDKRFLAFGANHGAYHKELLKAKWCLREWVGFDTKRLHSNEKLVDIVFVDWLQLNGKAVNKARKQAEQRVKKAAKNLGKQQKDLKKQLKDQGVDVSELVGEP